MVSAVFHSPLEASAASTASPSSLPGTLAAVTAAPAAARAEPKPGRDWRGHGRSLALAVLSWHLVESPALRLKRYLPRAVSAQSTAGAASLNR
mgnify:CR=1 FL=1